MRGDHWGYTVYVPGFYGAAVKAESGVKALYVCVENYDIFERINYKFL
jgi:hypothetical protein